MSQNLGDLKLNIILDVIKADENAKKFVGALKSVEVQSAKTETATVSLKSKFQNLGLTVDGIRAGFSILKATLGDFVTSFQQQEIATQKLVNGLKNVGEGAKALEILNKQASDLQNITVYDDAEINNAQAMLTTFMKSSDEIEILTPRILDLAAAFDQSGEGGKSLQEVAVMLGKVNEETIGALRRVGVAFSKEQEEKLKSLKGTEQAIYLAEILDQNFRGLAEIIGGTSAGKLRIFQNQVGELKEKFGELLVSALTPLLEPLKNFLDLIASSPQRVQTAALAVSALVTAFIALNGSIPGPLKYISLISAGVIGLPDHLRNLAIAIGAVTLAWKYQSTIVSGLDLLITRLGSNASAGFNALANAGSKASAILTLKLGAVATAIYAILELIDYINSNAEKMEKGTGKSDVLGGEDASLDNYFNSKSKGKNPNEFFTPEEQQKTQKEIAETKNKMKDLSGEFKNFGKTSADTGEDIVEVKTELQLLREEYDKLIEAYERPFKLTALKEAISFIKAVGKPIDKFLKIDDEKLIAIANEKPRTPIPESRG